MKYDKANEKAVMRLLDAAARKHGLADVRHAANKWVAGQRARLSLFKKQRALKRALAAVNRKMKG